MNCPVCDSTMVSLNFEKVPLSIKHLGNIYLCQVPVIRCYGGDHVSHQLPKRKSIYDLVCATLATMDRPLSRNEHGFLLTRLHYNSPAYTRHVVTSNVDYQCWKDDKYEILPQPDYQLNKLLIDKIRHQTELLESPPRKILSIDLPVDENGAPVDLDNCA